HLGVLDRGLAFLKDKHASITDSSSEKEMLYHKKWEQSNILSLVFLRMTIVSNINITIPQIESVKKYLMLVEECFRSTDKSLASILKTELTTIKYHGSRG
ncbi:hypothetical protein ERO13_D10G182560v2, partial [Gossypium hirsutum]